MKNWFKLKKRFCFSLSYGYMGNNLIHNLFTNWIFELNTDSDIISAYWANRDVSIDLTLPAIVMKKMSTVCEVQIVVSHESNMANCAQSFISISMSIWVIYKRVSNIIWMLILHILSPNINISLSNLGISDNRLSLILLFCKKILMININLLNIEPYLVLVQPLINSSLI
jgi:hypothetical protein